VSRRGTILVVEDEEYVRDSLVTWLERREYRVVSAGSAEEALGRRAHEGVDLVLTDLKLPGADGLTLVRRLGQGGPPTVVLTGHGTVSSAVECMKAGASDYLLKPVSPEELVLVVDRALAERRLRREVVYLREAADRQAGEPVGASTAWKEVIELLGIAAPVNTPVLLVGESGSGKEEAARYLHRKSARRAGPFVTVNCAAIPLELFESEFFGHRKGAFTGAVSDREGRFQVAHGGTLFLDEINSLPPLAQAKILRVLQDGVFERVGESRPTVVDVRLVCASNADLVAEVAEGRFRPDLFYRINVMTVRIPPLRERPEDIALLARTFLADLAPRLGKPVRALAREAVEALQAYAWPGNVRELRNVIERAVLLERAEELRPESLGLRRDGASPDGSLLGGADGTSLHLRSTLQRTERELLQRALEQAHGVRRHAARMLGIDERNLSYFLKKHGL
jgi:two-component system, NtrC family, response regulator AtoC